MALAVTNGTVIASYNEPGIQLGNGIPIVSIGSPLFPNWFVRYNSVQEQPISLGGTSPSSGLTINTLCNGNVGSTGLYRFSKFACPAGGGSLFNDAGANAYSSLWVQDCELYSGTSCFSGNTNTVTTLMNNLFDRSAFTATNTASTSLTLSNNLIFGATILLGNQATPNTWQAFNNAFDSCSISSNTTPPIGCLINGYNGYLNCSDRLWPVGGSDVVNSAGLAYQTGPLGAFYQSTNSPLINKGSTTADQAGLYHYTVTTNEVVEGTSTVSIGYHYAATDAYGNPFDSNSNGIPDCLEDANGNGLVDNGEYPWGIAILEQPQSQAVLWESSANFSVTVAGIPPISCQWYFNSAPITGATNTTLSLDNVQNSNRGDYYVVVSNCNASLTSSYAWLTPINPSNYTEVWISTSTNTQSLGTLSDPYDASAQRKFDSLMDFFPENTIIHLLAGTYPTLGTTYYNNGTGSLKTGQKILGSGMDNTIIQIVPGTVSASEGATAVLRTRSCSSNIEVCDLTCDCNYKPGTMETYKGVLLVGTQNAVRRVKVIHQAGYGGAPEPFSIVLENDGLPDSVGNIIEECEVSQFSGAGGPTAMIISGGQGISGVIRNNRVLLTPGGGGLGFGGAWSDNLLIEGNYADGVDCGVYSDTGSSTNMIVVHNTFRNCDCGAFFVHGTHQNMTIAYNNIELLKGAYHYAISYNNYGDPVPCTNIAIIGNTISLMGQGTGTTYALNLYDVTGVVCANNRIDASMANYFGRLHQD